MSEPTTTRDIQTPTQIDPDDFFASHPAPQVVAPREGEVQEITDPRNLTPEAQQVAQAQNPQQVTPPQQVQRPAPPQQPVQDQNQVSPAALEEVREMRNKAEMLDQLVGDPGANRVLTEYYNSQNRKQAGFELENVPDRPVLPKKPSGYSRAEALADPDSDSADYDQQFADYQFELSNWMADSHEIRMRNEDKRRQFAQQQYERQQQQQRAAYQKQQQQQQVINTLKNTYGMQDEQVKDFIQYTQNLNNSNSIDPWVQSWAAARRQAVTQPSQQTYAQQQGAWQPNAAPNPAVAQPGAPFQFQQQQPQFPRTAAGSSGEQPPASDNFLHNLMGDIARRDNALTNFVIDRNR